MDIFGINSGFYRFMVKVGDLMILNILYLLCCIPIVTIGASTTALYAVLLRMVRNEEGYVVKGFMTAIKENFKQATIIWGIFCLSGFVLYCDIILSDQIDNLLGAGLKIIFLLFAFIYGSVLSYVFALQSRYENKVIITLKNAFFLGMICLPYTVSLLVINSVLLFLVLVRPELIWYIIPIMCTVGVASITYISAIIINFLFVKFMEGKECKEYKV